MFKLGGAGGPKRSFGGLFPQPVVVARRSDGTEQKIPLKEIKKHLSETGSWLDSVAKYMKSFGEFLMSKLFS